MIPRDGTRSFGAASGSMPAGLSTAPASAAVASAGHTYVTLVVSGQLCGVPVQRVRDVLGDRPIARIPLAPPEVAGSLNLRGRIVTAIDLRRRLRLSAAPPGTPRMSVVTEQQSELYALVVDSVQDVIDLPRHAIEPVPPTLPPGWAAFATGIAQLTDRLLVVLDLDRLLALTPEEALT